MKRRASEHDQQDAQGGHSDAPACPHVGVELAPPAPSQDVYKDDCMWCFDSQPVEPVTRLAVVDAPEDEQYDYERRVVCMACDPVRGRAVEMTPQMQSVVDGIVHATSHAHKTEVHAWEEEIVPCEHTLCLQPSPMGAPTPKCSKCDLTSNLWMCLQCGHVGCGRAQFGGVDGHGHALEHFEQTSHPCSVKQGTITPEGEGDVYCYGCNDARADPGLSEHLQALGVPVANLSKTEKSMTELQLEQNIHFDFSMVGDDGQEMLPAYGPGCTGIQNLGNSCYLASTLQAVWSIAAFRERYADVAGHAETCTQPPAQCLECQLRKLNDGLESGRYASSDHPCGIKPAMLKARLGKGHTEFASMRQQDAEEFLQHFISVVKSAHDGADPTRVFGYVLEHRLQCTQCGKVRYTEETVDAGVGLPVPVRKKAGVDGDGADAYEPVPLALSLDTFTAPETIEYACPSCASNVAATKQTRFATLPDVLVVQAQRFQLRDWVPQKVPVPYKVPLCGTIDMSRYLGHGMQDTEEALPDSDAQPVHVDPEAMATLQSLGFEPSQIERAWQVTDGNLEACAHWLLEHGDEVAPQPPPASGAAPDTSALEDMGFSAPQARKAMRLHGNVEMAVAWLFENPDDPGDVMDAPPPPTEPLGHRDCPTYELGSFITHRGPSVHSGHYVAHVRTPGGWVFFNDDKVVHAPLHGSPSSVEALSDMAYLYFLRRVA